MNKVASIWSTAAMSKHLNKANSIEKGRAKPFSRVSHVAMLAVFLFSVVNPVMAGLTDMSMSMTMSMPMSASSTPIPMGMAEIDMSEIAGVSGTGDMSEKVDMSNEINLSETSSESMDCEQECNCCPGLCSAYLPANYVSSVFVSKKNTLDKIIINTEVITIAALFRPPITH